MRRFLVILAFVAETALPAGNWDRVLSEGWTPPSESFIYGYSEFTPSYLGGVRPYETYLDSAAQLTKSRTFREFAIASPEAHTFGIRRYEELKHLQPGLRVLANHWMEDLKDLTAGATPGGSKLKGIPKLVTEENPYWPTHFSKKGATSKTIVSLTPLALSRINKDLGRVHPWFIYGGAEQNWENLFWLHSFGKDQSPNDFFCRLLKRAFQKRGRCDLAKWNVGIFTQHPDWIPSELKPLIISSGNRKPLDFLITFEPYEKWGSTYKAQYAQHSLEVIPHPSTLLFSRSPFFEGLAKQTLNSEPLQIPLAIEFSQFASELNNLSFYGLGVLDVTRKTHRFEKTSGRSKIFRPIGFSLEDVTATLFSPDPAKLGVYDKPIARNTQLWGVTGALKGKWLLDGPAADRSIIEKVVQLIEDDRLTGRPSQLHYRNYFPPMNINGYSTMWYRPLVAWTTKDADNAEVDFSLLGSTQLRNSEGAEEWFPVSVSNEMADEALAEIREVSETADNPETTALNIQKLIEFSDLLGEKLSSDVASALLNPVDKGQETYSKWRKEAPLSPAAKALLDKAVTAETLSPLPKPLTFTKTVSNEFEWDYWKHIVALSEGPTRVNKNNTDCAATDEDEGPRSPHPLKLNKKRDEHCDRNHLPDVLEHIERYYRNELGLTEIYDQSFDWKTDFDFAWDGLKQKQHNLIVVIHGTDNRKHDEAIIMGDHYDTAPMGDIYEGESYAEKKKLPELQGHRHASKGSDDNYSATATLMQAAKVLKGMKLEKDVWLVHITGEEFPADGLGSRALIQALIENKPLVPGGNPKIAGIYILDMVAHSTDRDHATAEPAPAIFQIAPGRGERSAALAMIAHQATRNWNQARSQENWDAKHQRAKYWKRYTPPKNLPPEKYPLPVLGKFLEMTGEIRPAWHFRSSLYNTDIQLFSDVGIPSVLFMENYDINREGYHDTQDNLTNIDLDFGRGVLSIAIETVAQAASRK